MSNNSIGSDIYINLERITNNPTFIIPPSGNLISGNKSNGIKLINNSENNIFMGNFIG